MARHPGSAGGGGEGPGAAPRIAGHRGGCRQEASLQSTIGPVGTGGIRQRLTRPRDLHDATERKPHIALANSSNPASIHGLVQLNSMHQVHSRCQHPRHKSAAACNIRKAVILNWCSGGDGGGLPLSRKRTKRQMAEPAPPATVAAPA